MKVLFISDLHLTPECPAVARAFCRYLKQRAPQADALYILGDFFEYWVGDDAMDRFQREIVSRLKQFTDAGKQLFFMVGNRDFAVGRTFLQQTGAQWLSDPSVVTINQKKILLLHGDSLCTNDKHYQRYRKVIRNPLVLAILRLLPLSFRRGLAKKLRLRSKAANAGKTMSIMDVTQAAVTKIMHKHQVSIMIHGHTHRPDIHEVKLPEGGTGQRYVLGDWTDTGWEIELNENELSLTPFPITQ